MGAATCGRYWGVRFFCWSQISADRERGLGADLFIVGSRFLTQMGTPACFAAAGSARIEGAEITEDGFGSCTVATFAGGIFLSGNLRESGRCVSRPWSFLRPPHAGSI